MNKFLIVVFISIFFIYNLSADIKFGAMVLIKRYKKLIDCNITEYKILCKCMGGTNQLLDDIENNFRFEELSIEEK